MLPETRQDAKYSLIMIACVIGIVLAATVVAIFPIIVTGILGTACILFIIATVVKSIYLLMKGDDSEKS